MTRSTMAPLSLTNCALQSNPERPPSDFSMLQAANATWFRVAMLVPPDVPLVEFSVETTLLPQLVQFIVM